MVAIFFFRSVSSGEGNQSKNKQIGLYQTEKLSCNKGNHQQNSKATTKWEETGNSTVKNLTAVQETQI